MRDLGGKGKKGVKHALEGSWSAKLIEGGVSGRNQRIIDILNYKNDK